MRRVLFKLFLSCSAIGLAVSIVAACTDDEVTPSGGGTDGGGVDAAKIDTGVPDNNVPDADASVPINFYDANSCAIIDINESAGKVNGGSRECNACIRSSCCQLATDCFSGGAEAGSAFTADGSISNC